MFLQQNHKINRKNLLYSTNYIKFILKLDYNFLTISLPMVEKITAIGTEINIPGNPNIETAAHIENNNQTG
jgi:hypothetical protein